MKNLNIVSGVLSLALLLSSCEKDKGKRVEVPSKEKGNLQLYVTKTYNNKIIANQPVEDTLENGRKVIIESADIYLSDFGLEEESSRVSYTTQPLVLVRGNRTSFNLGQIDEGSYFNLRFNTGLSSTLNEKDNTYDLYLNDTAMWYNPTNNAERYVHIKIKGMVDTSANKNVIAMAPIELFLGGGTVTKPITLPVFTGINKGESTSLFLNVNFAKLFKDIDLLSRDNRIINTAPLSVSKGFIYRNNVDSMFSSM